MKAQGEKLAIVTIFQTALITPRWYNGPKAFLGKCLQMNFGAGPDIRRFSCSNLIKNKEKFLGVEEAGVVAAAATVVVVVVVEALIIRH
ncbi:hypothetical protein ElyMa_004395400 [Elysia marginata]|uniref:Uncharacterized protein n=1 Tax=Elysia marginata TaxID=1093978 RepID=A0AAV4H7R3_9GAST|nr:hypothetical protein ElyMa_004395400 [Elysia marginata]